MSHDETSSLEAAAEQFSEWHNVECRALNDNPQDYMKRCDCGLAATATRAVERAVSANASKVAGWESFKTMCAERGFKKPVPGGIVRWAQDRIHSADRDEAEIERLQELAVESVANLEAADAEVAKLREGAESAMEYAYKDLNATNAKLRRVVEGIENAIAEFGDDLPTCVKVIGEYLADLDDGGKGDGE